MLLVDTGVELFVLEQLRCALLLGVKQRFPFALGRLYPRPLPVPISDLWLGVDAPVVDRCTRYLLQQRKLDSFQPEH